MAGYFNPRTPRGVRLDTLQAIMLKLLSQFQSTHPARGATTYTEVDLSGLEISIHAPREGCDGGDNRCLRYPQYFNPRTP